MKHHAVGVDQEIFRAWHLGRDVRKDQIVPTMGGHQPVTGSQVHTGLPFSGADLVFHALDGGYAHGKDLEILIIFWQ